MVPHVHVNSMRVRYFHSPEQRIGARLQRLAALAGLEVDRHFQTAIDYAATDQPALVAKLVRTFRGKLPVWLDLNGRQSPLLWHRRPYRRAVAQAGLVTVATRGAWEELREVNDRVHLIPDPVTCEPEPGTPPAALLSPAIGYAGGASEWFLPQILVDLADQRRDWQVFIAGETAHLPLFQAAAKNRPNFHLAPNAGPEFWRRLQVAVLPFTVDRFNENWLPDEYLQAWVHNVPVVGTPLLEVARLDAPVLFATDPTGFIRQTQLLLDDPQQAGQRAAGARNFVAREHDSDIVANRLRLALTSPGERTNP